MTYWHFGWKRSARCGVWLLIVACLISLAEAQSTQAAIVGTITQITVDAPTDVYSGGNITVGDYRVIVPRNLLIDLPANRLTLQQIVVGSNVVGVPLEGQAMATILANRLADGRVIAGDILINKGVELLTGEVTFINYTDGYLRIEGSQAQDAGGVVLRINDPSMRHTIQRGYGCAAGNSNNCSPDDRFIVDSVNYTASFATGYPVCIPSTATNTTTRLVGGNASGVGDPLCPATNRSQIADPGRPPAAVIAGELVPESRRFAPVQVGDSLTANGNYEVLNGQEFFSAWRVQVHAKLTTRNDPTQPDYITFEESNWDVPIFYLNRVRTLMIGGSTLNREFDVFSLHTGNNNTAHEFPLATGVNNNDRLLGNVAGQIWRMNADVDFLAPPAAVGKLSPCVDLTRAGFNFCPLGGTLEEEMRIVSPVTREIIARTRHKKQLNAGVTTLDVSGAEASNGEYLTPVGIGYAEQAEVSNANLALPFSFEGVPWLLDRRLGPGGCSGGSCEPIPTPLCPFPASGLDPRQALNPATNILGVPPLPNKILSFFPFGPPTPPGFSFGIGPSTSLLSLPPFGGCQ
jgi:hypothetical protein